MEDEHYELEEDEQDLGEVTPIGDDAESVFLSAESIRKAMVAQGKPLGTLLAVIGSRGESIYIQGVRLKGSEKTLNRTNLVVDQIHTPFYAKGEKDELAKALRASKLTESDLPSGTIVLAAFGISDGGYVKLKRVRIKPGLSWTKTEPVQALSY